MTDPGPPVLPDRRLDAARLARDAGISDPGEMLALVADAYGADAVTAETADFTERALALATPQDGSLDG